MDPSGPGVPKADVCCIVEELGSNKQHGASAEQGDEKANIPGPLSPLIFS